MKRLSVACCACGLAPSEGVGLALEAKVTSTGDEAVPISGVHLSRKGINAFPEFAEGFGLDFSKVIAGLEPERYQIRVEMLASPQGRLLYGDGQSELRRPPSRTFRFVLPLPFQGIQYFLNAPAEDVFIAATSLGEGTCSAEGLGLLDILRETVARHGHVATAYNVNISVIVPMKEPPSDAELSRTVGKVNHKPIRPMPDT